MSDNQGGIKFDQDKAPMDLLPYEALIEISKVLGYGAKKYKKNNWKGGINYSRLIAASLRHIHAFNSGQTEDPETGINHMAHAACNLMFILYYMQQDKYKEFDDRG